jgi:hypothetical protein
MFHKSLRPYYLMGILIAIFLIITAVGGLVNPDIYKPFIKSDTLRTGLPVQDFVSLLMAPLLAAAMLWTGRGSARALVLWAGLLVSVGYYYAFYAFGYVYSVYYPLYLALVGLSLYSLIGLLTGVDLPAFAGRVRDRMPVRFIGVVLGMTLLFVPLWLMLILQGIRMQQPSEASLVFVLDLTILIPAMTIAAVQIWRRRPLGYLLGGVLLIKAAVSGILLTGGSLLQIALGFSVGPDFAMYIFLLIAGVAGVVSYMRNLR